MDSSILTPREIRRYQRQIMLPEIGLAGQEKLKTAKVLVIGAGGLGCPVLQYLSAAGVGRIGIVEFDMVNESNLQRQVLYGSMDVGKLKSIIAKGRLEHLNTFTEPEVINLRIDNTNAGQIIKTYDIVVDATDNWETRYVIDDVCSAAGKPMVHGAIYKTGGQVAVFNYKGGPSYRYYNPEKERAAVKNPAPAETGILGVLPGITGTIMANEVIKIITGSEYVLSGKLLIFNVDDYSTKIIEIEHTPEIEKRTNNKK
jgi:sulfur-carrier protein adenylyltransferase/sulfurtransferase